MKESYMNNRIAGTFFAVLVSVSSCRVHKHIAANPDKEKIKDTIAVVSKPDTVQLIVAKPDNIVKPTVPDPSEFRLKFLLNSLCSKHFQYTTFSGKARIRYTGPGEEKDEFTINFRVRKDSVIWATISALGGMVQGVRVLITPDSVFLINYLQKNYAKLPIRDIDRLMPSGIDFSSMQNVIIGEPIRDGIITEANDTMQYWTAVMTDSVYRLQLAFKKSDSTLFAQRLEKLSFPDPSAEIQTTDYETSTKGRFSGNREISVVHKNENYIINLKIISADFDVPLEYPFNIPKSYSNSLEK
jgi:Domain of unknown function (DUF4292)